MKYPLIGAAALFALAAPAMAGGDRMKAADSNGDGSVSRAEFQASISADWAKLDKDGNGQLTAAEAGGKADERWKAADTSGDGQLSASEYTASKTAWFTKADSNGDGALTAAEHHAAMGDKGHKKTASN